MFTEKSGLQRGGVILSIVALAGIAGMALGGMAPDAARLSSERPRWHGQRQPLTLAHHLAGVDEALAQQDAGRAAREWRSAYSLALASRRWEAMADMGDAAVRIDTLASRPSGHPTGFRAEARQAYLRALFQARNAKAPSGIERVARAFAALGDTEMAARARAIGGAP
jgi:hypothetical protein